MTSFTRLFSRGFVPALLVSFVLSFPAIATASSEAEDWMNNYYKNPAPAELSTKVMQLSREGYLDQTQHVPLAIGFIASVMAKNPDRTDEWVSFSRVLPTAHRRIVIASLWLSGNPRGADLMRDESRQSGDDLRAEVTRLLATEPALGAPVLSVSSLNLQWGSFLATGETAPVRAILAALGNQASGLGSEVRWSLAQNALRHDRVLTICRSELDRQPAAVQQALRSVITQVEKDGQPKS